MDQHDDGDVDDLKAADARELHRAVREEGEAELDRPAASLLWSALAAGLAITTSLLAEAVIHGATAAGPSQTLLVSLGYPVGFLIVILGRMQFFTESTVTATLPLVTRPSWWRAGRSVRLWGLVLAGNLAGTALATLALARLPLVDPELLAGMRAVAAVVLEHDTATTFWTAIPAGFLVAGIAWLLPNAREQSFWVIATVTYVVGAAGLSHSVVGSAEAFTLMWAGQVDAVRALVAMIAPAVIGNLIGGAGLFALLAHGQVHGEVQGERRGGGHG
jgi:formate/nitrite transporter FocA (FNT family)